MLKEAIAEAKTIKETAIANAKAALEEAFTPQVKEMFAAKLQEMEKEEERKSNEAMRNAGLDFPMTIYNAAKNLFTPKTPPAGSVTKTEKSTTVTPSKKRGGKC